MNPGLRYLLLKGPVALWRRTRRRFSGPRGMIALVGIALVLALLLVPQFLGSARFQSPERMALSAEYVRLAGPLALLLLVLAGAARGGIWFKPAEIQFLFPAPVGRRELLLYDALSKLRVQVLSGLWVSIFTMRYAPTWYASVVALILALAFLQLSGQTIGLLLSALEERAGRLVRRLSLVAVWVVLAPGVIRAFSVSGGEDGLRTALVEVNAWPPVRALTWLTQPLVNLYLSTSPGAVALWTAVVTGLLAGLVGLMLWLDFAYTEGALERAQKVQKALSRMRSGGGAFAAAAPSRRGLRIPPLPYWRGAGPIAWRQLQELARNYRSALMMGVMLLLIVGATTIIPRYAASQVGRDGPPPMLMAAIVLTIMAPLMVTNSAFDFRRDLDRMALLKSFPISRFYLCFGQIIPTALLVTVWELLAILVLGIWTGQFMLAPLIGFVLVVLPFNIVLIALDNVLFMKLPYRIVATDPGRMPFMPRLMLVMFLKMLLLFVLVALTAIPATVAWFSSNGNVLVTAAAGSLFLSACCVPMIFAVAWAFGSFDVSRDIQD